MKLIIIDCRQWSVGVCGLGLAGGRPSPGRCARCTSKQGSGLPTGETIEFAMPFERRDHTSICRERIDEEWRPDWRARLLAAGMTLGTRHWLPKRLLKKAMANRR